MKIVGSQLRPALAKFKAAVAMQQASVRNALVTLQKEKDSDNALVRVHNAYATYTSLFLLHITGHRPVLDPFCYRLSLNNQFAVIEDKAVTDRHACRIVALCQTAEEQLGFYLEHLRILSTALDPQGRFAPLVPELKKLVSSECHDTSLPLLFFLTRSPAHNLTSAIAEASLQSHLEGTWPWPLNAGRHLIATQLRDLGVSAELIDFQLGHLHPARQVCGPTSPWSIASATSILRPALQKIADLCGFQATVGLTPDLYLQADSRRLSTGNSVYTHGAFGPEVRKVERNKERENDREMVIDLLAKHSNVDSKTQFDQVANELIDMSAGKPIRLQHRLLYLWNIAAERTSGRPIRLPRRYYALLPPPSPFTRDLPSRVTGAIQLRTRFLAYLEGSGRNGLSPSPERRLSEIILSAALFGGLTNPSQLEQLAKFGPSEIQRLDQLLFTEFKGDKSSPEDRWIPDTLTGTLIGRWPTETINFKYVKSELRQLLRILDAGRQIHNPFQMLSKLSHGYWQFRMPGFIYSATKAGPETCSLSVTTVARLLKGIRLDEGEKPSPENIQSEYSVPFANIGGKGLRSEGRAFIRTARTAISEISKLPAKGHQRSRNNMKRALRNRFRHLLNNADAKVPAIAKLCVLWAIHLTDHGTSAKSDLAFGTIVEYFNCLAGNLLDAAADMDFLDLDGFGFEAVYQQAIIDLEGERKEYVGGRILEFHAFLVEDSCVEIPDWGFLPRTRDHANAVRSVDANLLTPGEYLHTLQLLENDGSVSAHTQMCTTALVVLGYRFGTRIGDGLRLRFEDLVLDKVNDLVIVHAHSNIFGQPKSYAGNRQIPLVGKLNNHEWRILQRLHDHFEERLKPVDPRASLFSNVRSPRAPIERRLLLSRIHLAMRLVSGDSALRYHHLRHSFANRLAVALLADVGQSQSWDVLTDRLWGQQLPSPVAIRELVTGTEAITDDTLAAIPNFLGHAAVGTSLQHYFHVMDCLKQAVVESDRPTLDAHAWSYVLDEPYDTVRKRLLRLKKAGNKNNNPPVGPGWNKAIREVAIPLARGRPPTKLPATAPHTRKITLETVDRVLLASAARDGRANGIANALLLTEGDVSRILETAKKFEIGSRFRRVQVSEAEDHLFGTALSTRIDASRQKETRRLREGLRQWQPFVDSLSDLDRNTLRDALQIWHMSALSAGNAPLFSQLSQIDAFLKGLNLLGISRGEIRVVLQISNKNAINQLQSALAAHGLNNIKTRRGTGAPGLEMRVGGPQSPFSYPRTFHRALFVLLIWLNTAGQRPDSTALPI